MEWKLYMKFYGNYLLQNGRFYETSCKPIACLIQKWVTVKDSVLL